MTDTETIREWATRSEREFRETEAEQDAIAEYQAAAYSRGYANAMRDLLSKFDDELTA